MLALTVAGGAELSAHRTDEYLQAARLAIDPGRVQIELDLTPGIALAETILADIDRNRDGSLSAEEQRAYGIVVLSALTLEVDGTPVRAQLAATSFPEVEAMRRGEGTIRLQSAATLPRQSGGFHQLLFRNRHHPERSVYLANALVPESHQVAVTAQRRDESQTELTIDYLVRGTPARPTVAWIVGGLVVATALSALLVRPLERSGEAMLTRLGSDPVGPERRRVRDVSSPGVTAPYMHNGVFATLPDVVAFYRRISGGGEKRDPYMGSSALGP